VKQFNLWSNKNKLKVHREQRVAAFETAEDLQQRSAIYRLIAFLLHYARGRREKRGRRARHVRRDSFSSNAVKLKRCNVTTPPAAILCVASVTVISDELTRRDGRRTFFGTWHRHWLTKRKALERVDWLHITAKRCLEGRRKI